MHQALPHRRVRRRWSGRCSERRTRHRRPHGSLWTASPVPSSRRHTGAMPCR